MIGNWQALHFEFAGWLSLMIVYVLTAGFIAWITYVATAVRRITKQMPNMVTREQLVEEFRKFKLELSE